MSLEATPVHALSPSARERAERSAASCFQLPAYGEALAAAGAEVTHLRVGGAHALVLEERIGPYRKWLGLAAPALERAEDAAPFWEALVRDGRALGRLAATWREAPIARLAEADLPPIRAACEAAGGAASAGALATYVVRLDASADIILARMEPRHRNRARKATAEDVRVARAEPTPEHLDAFCAMLGETYARSGLAAPARPYFDRLLREPWARLWLARDAAGAPVAGAIVTLWRGDATYLHGASVRGAHGASALLHAEIIRALAADGARLYDLGGIALPGTPGDNPRTAGIREFKARLGGELRLFPSLQVKIDPAGYDAARAAMAAGAQAAAR